MSNRCLITATMLLAIALGSTCVRAADKEEGEKKVSIKNVPAAVRKTLKREAHGSAIKSVDVQTQDGKTVYEADVEIDGHNYEILVDRKGLLLSKKLDEEEGEESGKSQAKSSRSSDNEEEEDEQKTQAKRGKARGGDEEKVESSSHKKGSDKKDRQEEQEEK